MFRPFLPTLAVALTATAAVGGGMDVAPVEPTPVAAAAPTTGFDWTGFYVGVNSVRGDFNDGDTTDGFDTSGFGIQAGYLRDLGMIVVGGELSYSEGDYGANAPESDWDATRLKLIGGYDAGRFLPYLFVGATKYSMNEVTTSSDSMTNYGIGGRYAFGATGNFVAGLEYLVESKDNFDNNFDLDNKELALRLDYRF
jgi:outer membrane immunogenic protein